MKQLQDTINDSINRIISQFKIRMEAYAIAQAPHYYRHVMASMLDKVSVIKKGTSSDGA